MSALISALTLLQPFASAIAIGPKRIENRPWRRMLPRDGLWVGLHAGKAVWPEGDEGKAELIVNSWREGRWPSAPPVADMPRGAMLGVMHIRECVTYDGPRAVLLGIDKDPWAFGPWCWVVDEVRLLPKPEPIRGMQGLWPVRAPRLAQALAELAAVKP